MTGREVALAFALLVSWADVTKAATLCPADRLVFRDRSKGLVFGVERVATDYTYLCNGKAIKSQWPRSDLKDCRGPFGDTVYEGFINGAKVYAVYTVIAGSPCCSWDSFSSDSVIAKKTRTWLPSDRAPQVMLGSKWATISGDDTNPVTGPLGGGRLVPDTCRSR